TRSPEYEVIELENYIDHCIFTGSWAISAQLDTTDTIVILCSMEDQLTFELSTSVFKWQDLKTGKTQAKQRLSDLVAITGQHFWSDAYGFSFRRYLTDLSEFFDLCTAPSA